MNYTVVYYRFGDTVFCIETPGAMKQDPRFEAFAVPPTEHPTYILTVKTITVEMCELSEWPAYVTREGNHLQVYLNTELIPNITVANLLVVSHADLLLPEQGGFLLHASYIHHNGEAILFSAPCETGKSTQAHFWAQERGSTVVNEDRVLVFSRDGEFYAAGIWATGSAGVTKNITAPIRAVVLLGQGPENRVTVPPVPLRLQRLMSQSTYDPSDPVSYRDVLLLACSLIDHVKVISYDCINHPSSVRDLEAYLYE